MAHLIDFAACSILLFTIVCVNCSEKTMSFDDEVRILRNSEPNPSFRLLHRLNKQSLAGDSSTKMQTVYKLGNRVEGDSIRKNKTASFGFDEPVGFQAVINYPNLGDNEPAIVSYVEIYVIQSSDLGQAYIKSGGIGQRQITVVIEAQEVDFFGFEALFYGYD